VNKTIEYTVNEALNIGRLSANVQFFEAEVREKIAQEIEVARAKYLDLASNKESEDYQFYLGVCNGMNFAMLIARGNSYAN
jgi:hypothetical protein